MCGLPENRGAEVERAYRDEMRGLESRRFPDRLRPSDPDFVERVTPHFGPVAATNPDIITNEQVYAHPIPHDRPHTAGFYGVTHVGGRPSATAGGEAPPTDPIDWTVFPESEGGVWGALSARRKDQYYGVKMKPNDVHVFGKGQSPMVYSHELRHRADPMLDEVENRMHDYINAPTDQDVRNIKDVWYDSHGKDHYRDTINTLRDREAQDRLFDWEYRNNARQDPDLVGPEEPASYYQWRRENARLPPGTDRGPR